MNTVEYFGVAANKNYKVGDIFFKPSAEEYYILTESGSGYSTICLNDGVPWHSDEPTIESAVAELNFIGRNMKITLSKNQD